ncbi:MAG: hypothetical protein ACRDJE_20290 [Dehalococcoidia bacterium]
MQGRQGRFVLGWQLPKGDDGPRLSRRVCDLIDDPQAMGTYMTYREALTIPGSDEERTTVPELNAAKLYGFAVPNPGHTTEAA